MSAKGEFGQLQRGLGNLRKDLNSVLGEIDKGARRGGIFDKTQLRALDLYRARFKESMADMNREYDKQVDAVKRLNMRRNQGSTEEQTNIRKEVRQRQDKIREIRKEQRAMEDLLRKRNEEARQFQQQQGQGGMGGGSGFGGRGLNSGLNMLKGVGGVALGLAGIGGVTTIASQAYGNAYNSQVSSLDLAQRIRGQAYGGSAKNMWDTMGSVGRSDQMGYTTQETWQFQDQYSRQAGALDQGELKHLLKFARGYGLSTSEVAGGIGGVRELGGAETASHFADMIAKSVDSSGMTPRILEVMQTSASLLQEMSTTLKDTGAKQILAYQTTLDTIGIREGMMGLTGSQGANVIGGLGGIFTPGGDDKWKWMGIQALQKHDPDKYGGMGLFDLERSFEDGLLNNDNLPAMVKYLREKSGGNEEVLQRMLQKWLQDGGYNATKTQVSELYEATDGLSVFDNEVMEALKKSLDSGDATENYQKRMSEIGQGILDTNARYEKALEDLGQPILTGVQFLKESVTSLAEIALGNGDISSKLTDIYNYLDRNWGSLATIGSILALGLMVGKVGAMLLGGIMTLAKIVGLGGLGRGVPGVPGAPGTGGKPATTWGDKAKNAGKWLGRNKGAIAGSATIIGIGANTILDEREKNGQFQDYQDYIGSTTKEERISNLPKDTQLTAYEPSWWEKTKDKITGLQDWVRYGSSEVNPAQKVSIDSQGNPYKDNELEDWLTTEFDPTTKRSFTALTNFSNEGFSSVDRFSKSSGVTINGMSNDVTDLVAKMERDSVRHTEALKVAGIDDFNMLQFSGTKDINKLMMDGTEALDNLYKEHEGFKPYFGSLWKDFIDGFNNLLFGMTGGSGDLTDKIVEMITKGEGTYDSVVKRDGNAMSIGKMQWNADRAKNLLKQIHEQDPETFNKYLGNTALGSEVLDNSRSFAHRALNDQEASRVSQLLNTGVGRQVQDNQARKDVGNYMEAGKKLGITDPKAMAYFADLYNQRPASAIAIAKASGNDLQKMHEVAMSDGIMGKFSTRRDNAFKHAQDISAGGYDGEVNRTNGLIGAIRDRFNIGNSTNYDTNFPDPSISTTGTTAGIRGKGYAGMTEYTEAMWNNVVNNFPNAKNNFMGGFVNREIRGKEGTGSMSMHAFGRAFDVGGTPKEMQSIAEYVKTLPQVQHVIYDRKISSNGSSWRDYKGQHPHHDHVHVDFKYRQGTPHVPGDQVALLHEGEAVIPKEFNPFNRANGVDESRFKKVRNLKDLFGGSDSVSAGSSSNSTIRTEGHVRVDVNVTGEQAHMLNQATTAQLMALVEKAIQQLEQRRLSVNPTTRGW